MDFKKIEKKWQDKWKESKVFQSEVDPKRKKFFFSTPYPYISGSLHIGHARAIIESDIYTRFKRMNGFNVLWGMGFHISGTPVIGISAAIASGDEKKVKLYEEYVSAYEKDKEKVKDIVQSFKDPQKIVDFFMPKMIFEYSRLGAGIDWRRSFTSGDPEHQALVEWQFMKYKQLGFLLQDSYHVLYCTKEKHAVGEDDIVDGDVDPVERQEWVLVKLKLGKDFLVAATLRPEAVFGQTNVWIKPDAEYAEVKVGKESWIVSKTAAKKLKLYGKTVKIEKEFKGEHLIGKKAKATVRRTEIPVLPATFIDPDFGTGVVFSTPSNSVADYAALMDFGKDIEIVPFMKTDLGEFAAKEIYRKYELTSQNDDNLDEAEKDAYKHDFHTGVLDKNCGKFSGMKVSEAKEKIKEWLIKEGKAEKILQPSRHAVCRCGGEIQVAFVKNQWFLDFNANNWKKKAYDCLEEMEIYPDSYRKQFENTFDWLDKRPTARRRGLGTKLPFDKDWVIESLSDSTMYMILYTMIPKMRSWKMKKEQMTEEFFDYVILGNGNPSIISKKIKLPATKLKDLRNSFEYWYPNDHRHTFMAHVPNHLPFFIFAHAGLLPEKDWPKKITVHGMVLSNGEKMSKSKGNVITLLGVSEKYGADVFRAYMASASDMDSKFDWNNNEAEAVRKHVTGLKDLLIGVIQDRKVGNVGSAGKWFLSVFNTGLDISLASLNRMSLREYATTVLYKLPNAYRDFTMRAGHSEVAAVNQIIVEDWIKFVSPLVPHLAEELWSMTGKRTYVSTDLWPKTKAQYINKSIEAEYNYVKQVASDIEEIKKLAKIEIPGKVTIFVTSLWKYHVYKSVMEDVGLKEIMRDEKTKKLGNKAAQYYNKLKQKGQIEELFLTVDKEEKALNENLRILERAAGTKVDIIHADKSQSPKAAAAEPGKPGILIE